MIHSAMTSTFEESLNGYGYDARLYANNERDLSLERFMSKVRSISGATFV
jgi:hypothetical protein